VKRNIDQLEASQYKAMKSQLNEDNYKSQMEITRMKKNYEDLQKKIDSLN
jgi:predicted nuclease with TOPRIM domain